MIRILKRISISLLFVLSISSWTTFANADPASAAPDTETAAPAAAQGVSVELNKLEPSEKGCRAYVVVNNLGDTVYKSYKIDLVLFQTDGVIGKRFLIDLAPLKAKKKSVKLFEIDGIKCDRVGSFLINDIMECKGEAGPVPGCLEHLKTTTLTNVQLSK